MKLVLFLSVTAAGGPCSWDRCMKRCLRRWIQRSLQESMLPVLSNPICKNIFSIIYTFIWIFSATKHGLPYLLSSQYAGVSNNIYILF